MAELSRKNISEDLEVFGKRTIEVKPADGRVLAVGCCNSEFSDELKYSRQIFVFGVRLCRKKQKIPAMPEPNPKIVVGSGVAVTEAFAVSRLPTEIVSTPGSKFGSFGSTLYRSYVTTTAPVTLCPVIAPAFTKNEPSPVKSMASNA